MCELVCHCVVVIKRFRIDFNDILNTFWDKTFDETTQKFQNGGQFKY